MKSLTLLALLAFTVSAVAQPNDSFGNRTTVDGAEVSVTGSNVGATKEGGEPNHAGNAGGMSVWWSWTAPASGDVTISTAGSNFDTLLAVYRGNSVGNLNLVAENDDAGGTTSAVSFAAEAGTTYHIAVDGYNDAGNVSNGSVQLTIAAGDGGGGGGGGIVFRNAMYNGLISNADELTPESSGYITMKTTQQGRFSAKMLLGGQKYSASGTFDGDGAATALINRRGAGPVELSLQMEEDASVVYGNITDGEFYADVAADIAGYNRVSNPAPQAGVYTLVIAGSEDSSVAPGGASVGSVIVSPDGKLKFKGVMADGTKVSQSSVVSERSQWPLYVPMKKGGGSLVGWLTFNPEAEDDIYGPVTWFKLPTAKSRNYRDGFQLDTYAIGSSYQAVKGAPIVDWESGQLVLDGAHLTDGMVQEVVVTPKGQIGSAAGDKSLKLKVSPKNGLMKGIVVDPSTGQKLKLNGVLLQKQGYGTGFFLTTDQSGNVYLGP